MSAPIRSSSIITGILVLLLATAFVPNASASVVTWELTANTFEGGPLVMDGQAPGLSAKTVPIPDGASVVWVSNVPAEAPLTIAGAWTLSMAYTSTASSALITLGTWNGGTFTPVGDAVPVAHNVPLDVTRTVNVSPGDHIAISVARSNPLTGVTVTTGGINPSTVSTPDSDPNFPVPELGSILLLAAGLGVVGSVVYMKRRQA